MFKYLAEILKQFTQSQKMLALIILLISSISVVYINSITKTPEELTKTITLQRQQMIIDQNKIFDLSGKVSNLNDSLLKSNQSCNERAFERENYFNEKLIAQQRYITTKIEELEAMLGRNKPKVLKSVYTPDSLNVKMVSTTTIIDDNNNDEIILKKLKAIKNKINR